MAQHNRKVPERAREDTRALPSENTNLRSMTNEAPWREFVSAHKKLATMENLEQLVAGMKLAEADRSRPYLDELGLLWGIEQMAAELRSAVAARSDRIVEEARRRD